MPDRFKTGEKLMANARAGIPAAAIPWLAAVRKPLEKLTMAALSGDVTDEQFEAMVKKFSESLPGLLKKMDHAALAVPLEEAMGAAMANGLAARDLGAGYRRDQEEQRAKLPWETDAWLAGKGKGKRCGNSWIASWKKCGDGDGREWDAASAEDAAVLARLTGKPFKAGARILLLPQEDRHTGKGHAH